jgi:hypothetical protein
MAFREVASTSNPGALTLGAEPPAVRSITRRQMIAVMGSVLTVAALSRLTHLSSTVDDESSWQSPPGYGAIVGLL